MGASQERIEMFGPIETIDELTTTINKFIKNKVSKIVDFDIKTKLLPNGNYDYFTYIRYIPT